jgi:hypothetical protein
MDEGGVWHIRAILVVTGLCKNFSQFVQKRDDYFWGYEQK